ncbi:hypothetical protein [Staphylococcus epidermidis]|uniref:hypothetical protein n=1 Tax=Staphylococcus epidermidis TaxID=1282 RepID=UPI00280ACCAA|nr:hypothetical protein [Staphylococcus epidermidis]
MGGFYGIKKSNKENASRVMIAAHMDEIGFMITHINDNGMIQFTNLGGVANDIWQGQRLKIKNRYGKEIIGVVANIPKHFRTGNEAYLKSKIYARLLVLLHQKKCAISGCRGGDTIVPHT